MAISKKDFEYLDISCLKTANSLIRNYSKFFECLGLTEDQYNRIINRIINALKKERTNNNTFNQLLENEIIQKLKVYYVRNSKREKTLEAFVDILEDRHCLIPVNAIKEFDKLINSIYDPTEVVGIISFLMSHGGSLAIVMEKICETYVENINDEPKIKIQDPTILKYINMYLEIVGSHSKDSSENASIDNIASSISYSTDISGNDTAFDYVMQNVGTPSFTENQMESIGKSILRGDEKAKKDLVASECKLLKQIVNRYKDCGIEYKELINVGYRALEEVADKFNYTMGIKFKTIATTNIERRIAKRILFEWENVKGYSKKWKEIEKLERRLISANETLTGKIIDEELGVKNGNLILKIYRLKGRYDEQDIIASDDIEEDSKNIKKKDDIPALLDRIQKTAKIKPKVFELYVLLKGLKNGVLRSDKEISKALKTDANKIREYRISVEMAINNNQEARAAYNLLLQKREEIVESVRSELRPIMYRSQKSIIFSSGINPTDYDKGLIALYEEKIDLPKLSVFFQKTCDSIKERIHQLKGNYSIEEKNIDKAESKEEGDNMAKPAKTLREALMIGEIMSWEEFLMEFEQFDEELKKMYYLRYGKDLDQASMHIPDNYIIKINNKNATLRDRYKRKRRLEESQKDVPIEQILSPFLPKKPVENSQTVLRQEPKSKQPEERSKLGINQETGIDGDLEREKNNEKDNEMIGRFPKSYIIEVLNRFSDEERKSLKNSYGEFLEKIIEIIPDVFPTTRQALYIFITKKLKAVSNPTISTSLDVTTPLVREETFQTVEYTPVDNLISDKSKQKISDDEFLRVIDALKESSLTKELYLSLPVRDGLIVKLFLGLDSDFQLTSFNEISSILNVEEEVVTNAVKTFFNLFKSRLDICESTILERGTIKIKKSGIKPDDNLNN